MDLTTIILNIQKISMQTETTSFTFTLGELLFLESTLRFMESQIRSESQETTSPDVALVQELHQKILDILYYAKESIQSRKLPSPGEEEKRPGSEHDDSGESVQH